MRRYPILASHHLKLAVALALSVVAAGMTWTTRVAAGSDAYGYVSQVDLWLRGDLFIDQHFAADVPWPLARWTFTPLGYRPEPDGYRIVPAYSPGLPMLMAAAKAIAGQCAIFWVVPLAGGALVFATYWIGRRMGRPFVGLAAAWIVATSPAMLFMMMAPMSDVPAAAAWAVAVACAMAGGERKDREGRKDGFSGWALAAGVASAIAILIRPNLVPLAAVLALWTFFERKDREDRNGHSSLRALRPLRSFVIFVATASLGAIAVAVINARLYGSPFASGYGDLSTAYSWSFILPNLGRYGSWLVSAETPLAVAGLAALFIPARWLWPTSEGRSGRWLLAGVAVAVWGSYLIYVPWDAWWYLRFLLPAWPMMAIGAATLVAAIAGERSLVRMAVVAAAVLALGIFGVKRATRLGTFDQARGEAKYVEVAKAVETVTPPDAVIISGQHSGSLRYYAGRPTLRWDYLDPQWLDRAVEWLSARGHHVYVVLEAPEAESFRSRFAPANAVGRVDWPPLVSFRRGAINLYDAVDRTRFERPIEQPTLRAVRECLPQKPPPRLR